MPAPQPHPFPVDEHGFVRQCAWCRRVADRFGAYRLACDVLIQGASHGCCDACAAHFLSHPGPRLVA